MAPFDPALMDDIRQALGATGVEVVIKSVEAPAQLTTSADLTMQMLQERYKK
jgi:EAL domain-containing protein (putative c-di-GMP-specific phosphodiesterase class I)